MKYILAQDKSMYSSWQIETAVRSLIDLNVQQSDIFVLLGSYGYSRHYKTLFTTYRKINFIEYRNHSMKNYKPSIKPYLLWKFFEEYTHLVREQWMLIDCDVILTKLPKNFNANSVHVSNCSSYINIDYINECGYTSKEFASYLNIGEEVIKGVDKNIGGAQYVFSNVKAEVWQWAYENLALFMHNIRTNPKKIDRESPFQIWCSEMFLVAYSLELHGHKLKHSKKLDFSWSTDLVRDIKPIIHNAGVTGKEETELFNKGNYFTKLPEEGLELDINYVSSVYYENVIKRNKW